MQAVLIDNRVSYSYTAAAMKKYALQATNGLAAHEKTHPEPRLRGESPPVEWLLDLEGSMAEVDEETVRARNQATYVAEMQTWRERRVDFP